MAQLPQATMVAVVSLTPAPWNPRTIKDPRFQNLCQSLQADPDFLQLRPILSTLDGTVFAGNMRLRAAQHLGWEEVPAILVDIPEQLAKERAMRDNAQWAEWEEDDLAKLLAGLRARAWLGRVPGRGAGRPVLPRLPRSLPPVSRREVPHLPVVWRHENQGGVCGMEGRGADDAPGHYLGEDERAPLKASLHVAARELPLRLGGGRDAQA